MNRTARANCASLLALVLGTSAAWARQSVNIAPTYPATLHFRGASLSTDTLTINGNVAGLTARKEIDDDRYLQRFVKKEGAFRIIHVIGVETATIVAGGRTLRTKKPFRDVTRFDDQGIFDTGAADPVSLIPLYPGRPISPGNSWVNVAAVKTAFGTGRARFVSTLGSVFRGAGGRHYARISVVMQGTLMPTRRFAGSRVKVVGGGWLLFDLDVHQRAESHLRAIYTSRSDRAMIAETIVVHDRLQQIFRRASF